MAVQTQYVPGACNIGPAEIRRRRQSGWIGLAATAALWVIFLSFGVPAPWRLFLFLPASIGAAGFLQAGMHFCANFGMRGVFNFGPDVGRTDTVEQAEFRRRDRAKAGLIGLYSFLAGALVAAAGVLLKI